MSEAEAVVYMDAVKRILEEDAQAAQRLEIRKKSVYTVSRTLKSEPEHLPPVRVTALPKMMPLPPSTTLLKEYTHPFELEQTYLLFILVCGYQAVPRVRSIEMGGKKIPSFPFFV
jgi:hypothetical protein